MGTPLQRMTKTIVTHRQVRCSVIPDVRTVQVGAEREDSETGRHGGGDRTDLVNSTSAGYNDP